MGENERTVMALGQVSAELATITGALTAELARESGPGRSVPAILATPEEAALALRVSRSKVYALMRSGALCSVKIGGSRRIPAEALRMLVESLVRAG